MKQQHPINQFSFSKFWQLAFLFAFAVLLTTWLTTGNVTATVLLFQSPPPAETPAMAQSEPITSTTQATASPIMTETQAVSPPIITPTATTKPVLPTATPLPKQSNPTEPPVNKPHETGTSNWIFDQAEFIDTIVLFGSWIWLCCGIGIFLLVPLVMLLLQIRGHSKIKKIGV